MLDSMYSRKRRRWIAMAAAVGGLGAAGLAAAVFTALFGSGTGGTGCGEPGTGVMVGPPGAGRVVGATEYGGPGDPSSGTIGSSGISLSAEPDSYAELGGLTFQTAADLGGLPYGTPLRVTWGRRSAIAYKRDIGFGGGAVAGLPRVIDLWWQLAGRLGIPYEHGLWSGVVRIERPPATGAAAVLQQVPQAPVAAGGDGGDCAGQGAGTGGLALSAGPRATLLADGQAAAPRSAPAAVKAIIAAGNQIVGKPYVWGGGHGLPLSAIASAYDCSSSVSHLLWGGGLMPSDVAEVSGDLMSFGAAGPGRWVTLYASPVHVFLYVAGLRWDTHDAAGPGDGGTGIGWHPLVRDAAGFVARHPVGL
jgi:hypothetical protein